MPSVSVTQSRASGADPDGQAVRLVVLMFTLVVARDKFGFQVAPLGAGIGVAGLGVGIALQGVLSNMWPA
jgi:small-conductance mechanosensitive channel